MICSSVWTVRSLRRGICRGVDRSWTRPLLWPRASTIPTAGRQRSGRAGPPRRSGRTSPRGHARRTWMGAGPSNIRRPRSAPTARSPSISRSPFMDCKSHISIGRMHGIIRRQVVTDAARQDGARLREGLIARTNTPRSVRAQAPIVRSGTRPGWRCMAWRAAFTARSRGGVRCPGARAVPTLRSPPSAPRSSTSSHTGRPACAWGSEPEASPAPPRRSRSPTWPMTRWRWLEMARRPVCARLTTIDVRADLISVSYRPELSTRGGIVLLVRPSAPMRDSKRRCPTGLDRRRGRHPSWTAQSRHPIPP